jgi:ribosomal protein S18 acetylase RimI-like enzyme
MAALSQVSSPELVELRDLKAGELDPLLNEEGLTWRTQLSWDFEASAELVRRFLKIQALSGYALVVSGRPIGYSYYVVEDHKALIGDLYIAREFSCTEYEDYLLQAVLDALTTIPYLQRVEAQLLMLRSAFDRPLPYMQYAQVHMRHFMMIDLDDARNLPAGKATGKYQFPLWTERRQEEAAQLIAKSYSGHIDSSINDQYRSFGGARRFLQNIVQYPGCGTFFDSASILAEGADHRLAGMSLASLVAPEVGHITQICVAPDVQRTGLGYELMRRSLQVFGEHDCEKASLTVTGANTEAVRLYQSLGFRSIRRFGAFVWEGI